VNRTWLSTELCRQQEKIIHNHANATVRNVVEGEAMHRNYKLLKLGGGQVYDR
jgi:hypothetical protein